MVKSSMKNLKPKRRIIKKYSIYFHDSSLGWIFISSTYIICIELNNIRRTPSCVMKLEAWSRTQREWCDILRMNPWTWAERKKKLFLNWTSFWTRHARVVVVVHAESGRRKKLFKNNRKSTKKLIDKDICTKKSKVTKTCYNEVVQKVVMADSSIQQEKFQLEVNKRWFCAIWRGAVGNTVVQTS
jgi:hypothetical protein